jgi:autotransporter translocation and assembly factor TamB
MKGRARVTAELASPTLNTEDVRGHVVVDLLDVAIAGVPIVQETPGRLEVDAGQIRVASWRWTAAGNPFEVSGRIALDATRDLDLAMMGAADLRLLRSFVPGLATSGHADLGLRLHGPAAAAAADGTIRIRDAELIVSDPPIAFSNASGTLILSGQRIQLTDFEGDANGGRTLISGELRHEGLRVREGRLVMSGRGVSLNVPQGLRTEVDADLVLAIAANRPELSGTVTIQRV